MNVRKRTELHLKPLQHIWAYLLACGLIVIGPPARGLAQQNSDPSSTTVQHARTERDGQHDFDFEIGTWKTHLARLQHPLTGSTTWVEYEGTTVEEKR